ncbi:MAG: hypothetical protein OEZ14_13335, partial [Acidimicrobiia bacterium]|nr:hypothetical protein [Acidimicrobiia bacterium]
MSVEFGSVIAVVVVSSPLSRAAETEVGVADDVVAPAVPAVVSLVGGSGTVVVPPPDGSDVGATVVDEVVDDDVVDEEPPVPDSCAAAGPESRVRPTTITHATAAALVRPATVRPVGAARRVGRARRPMPSWHASSRKNIGVLFGSRGGFLSV